MKYDFPASAFARLGADYLFLPIQETGSQTLRETPVCVGVRQPLPAPVKRLMHLLLGVFSSQKVHVNFPMFT